MSNATQILTPVGRLVQGSPFEPQTLDAEGRPLVVKSGPNAGQPRQSFFLALAIPKSDPGVGALYTAIVNVARASFPQFFDAAGNCTNPKFAFKITDGDSQVPNSNGIKPCDREGYPGNWVFKFSNGFAPKCYTKGGASIITNKEEIKCGYYIRIYASIAGNDSAQQPGVYLNVSMVELVGYGEEITFGPSGDAVFGGAPVTALPAGASATPPAPRTPLAAPPLPGAVPGGLGALPVLPGAPALPTAGPALPANVTPAPDFLTPPAPVMPPAPPAPPVEERYQAPNGVIYTRAQLVAAGWQEPQIATLKRV